MGYSMPPEILVFFYINVTTDSCENGTITNSNEASINFNSPFLIHELSLGL